MIRMPRTSIRITHRDREFVSGLSERVEVAEANPELQRHAAPARVHASAARTAAEAKWGVLLKVLENRQIRVPHLTRQRLQHRAVTHDIESEPDGNADCSYEVDDELQRWICVTLLPHEMKDYDCLLPRLRSRVVRVEEVAADRSRVYQAAG